MLKNRSEHKILIGDYNLTLNVELDRLNTYCNNNKARDKLIDLMDEFLLRDTWRIQNENKKEFSWIKGGNEKKASRIDFALVSAGLDQSVKAIMYINGIKSDHRALYMVVETNNHEWGRGFWKLNNSLLSKIEYIEIINKEIDNTICINKQTNPIETWEKLKKRIKKQSIEFSRNNTSQDKLILSQLSEKVCEYESNFPLNDKEHSIYMETKMEHEEKALERTRAIMFRSKVQWYEEGEKIQNIFTP